jgi:hypothetical protein
MDPLAFGRLSRGHYYKCASGQGARRSGTLETFPGAAGYAADGYGGPCSGVSRFDTRTCPRTRSGLGVGGAPGGQGAPPTPGATGAMNLKQHLCKPFVRCALHSPSARVLHNVTKEPEIIPPPCTHVLPRFFRGLYSPLLQFAKEVPPGNSRLADARSLATRYKINLSPAGSGF